ncbi:uncharacterized protein IAS62_004922 [Cryptococcus decagattii]|uniref:C3H1-type domain-containing protein n=1 Tax=Cryptococcus decagattii TaxID=1859122 RepID=A0ABZ2B1P6_9TREE
MSDQRKDAAAAWERLLSNGSVSLPPDILEAVRRQHVVQRTPLDSQNLQSWSPFLQRQPMIQQDLVPSIAGPAAPQQVSNASGLPQGTHMLHLANPPLYSVVQPSTSQYRNFTQPFQPTITNLPQSVNPALLNIAQPLPTGISTDPLSLSQASFSPLPQQEREQLPFLPPLYAQKRPSNSPLPTSSAVKKQKIVEVVDLSRSPPASSQHPLASAATQPSVDNARAHPPLEKATGPPPTTQRALDSYFTASGENGHYQAFSGKHMPSPSSHEHSIDEVKKAEISNGPSTSSSKTVANEAIPAPNPVVDMSTIRSLIDTEILKKSNSPGSLFKHLRMRGEDDKELPSFTPNPDELLEILIQLRDHAPGAYLAKMADNDRYVQVWQKWLKQCRKEPEVWEKIMVPLLEVLSRTEMPLETAKEYGLNKHAMNLPPLAKKKNLSSAGAIQAAFDKYSRYLLAVHKRHQEADAKAKENKPTESGSAGTKRKANQAIKDEGKVKEESSTKRPAIKSSVSSTKPSSVSGTPKSSAKLSTVSDMSFFSAPAVSQTPKLKPKPTSVSLKSAASQTPTALSTAKSFTLGNFLATMNNTQGTAQNSTTETKKESKEPKYTAKGRLIRSVRWKEDAQLEEVREFSQPAWEKELMGHGPKVSVHELDMQEGAMLAMNRNRGDIDWYEPTMYLETSSNFPVITEEVQYQMERERGILSVQYLAGEVVPDPAEDNVRIVEDDESTRYMSPAVVVEDSQKDTMLETAPAAASVQSLLANLQGIPLQQSHILGQPHYPGAAPPAMSFTANSATPFPSYYTEQHPTGWGAPQVPTSSTAGHEQYWEQRGSYDHSQSGLKGKGKKKRGTWQIEKKGTRTCQYWLQGDCKYGDACHFAHTTDL